MIILDPRAGSGDLEPYFRALGAKVTLAHLDSGDVAFVGNGPEGAPVQVGVEIKKLRDAIQCMGNGRFAGTQLPTMTQEFDQVWLVVEGNYRPDPATGLLQIPMKYGSGWGACYMGQRRFMYQEFNGWLMSLQMKAGVRVWKTSDRAETARWVRDLYSWWCNKEWEEHRSHLAFDESKDKMALLKPTLLRRVAKELPDIHWVRSGAVSNHFSSVHSMVNAEEREWTRIEGIGKGIAGKVWKAIRERVR